MRNPGERDEGKYSLKNCVSCLRQETIFWIKKCFLEVLVTFIGSSSSWHKTEY